MSFIRGSVERVLQRGNATNILVAGEWFGCGFNGVPCKQGDTVEFPYEVRGKFKNANVAQMVILDGGGGGNNNGQQQQSQSYNNNNNGGGYQRSQRSAPNNSGGKDEYWKNREKKDNTTQKAIQFQAARNSAIAVASSLIAAGQLELGDGGRNKKNPVDVALDFIDTLTARYAADVDVVTNGGSPFDAPTPSQEYQEDDTFNDDVPF